MNATVEDGAVQLWGVAYCQASGKAAQVAAESTPAVKSVDNRIGLVPPWLAAELEWSDCNGRAGTLSNHGKSGGHLPSSGRALTISGWLTGIYFVIELAIGLYTGSISVISDAFHTFSAVGGVLLAIMAARLARRPADPARTFGWYRAEIIGALINGAFLLVMAVVVIVMGTMRLTAPIDLPTAPMLLAAAGGLFTEFVSIYLLYKQQGHDLNIRGAFWHVLQTFVGSIIIIIAALVIEFTGFLAIDPILGILFGFVLLWASWGIMRDAMHLLMEGTPPDVDLARVVATLSDVEHVRDVHHVHAWALTSNRYVFSAHLRIDPEGGAETSHIQRQVHALLKDKFGFFFSTVQLETTCLDESASRAIDTMIADDQPWSATDGSGAHRHE